MVIQRFFRNSMGWGRPVGQSGKKIGWAFSPRPLGRPIPGAFHPSGQRTPAGDPVLPQAGMGRAFGALRGRIFVLTERSAKLTHYRPAGGAAVGMQREKPPNLVGAKSGRVHRVNRAASAGRVNRPDEMSWRIITGYRVRMMLRDSATRRSDDATNPVLPQGPHSWRLLDLFRDTGLDRGAANWLPAIKWLHR
jgi:hypothetical protein